MIRRIAPDGFGLCDPDLLTAPQVTTPRPRILVAAGEPPIAGWTGDPSVLVHECRYFRQVVEKVRFDLAGDTRAAARLAAHECIFFDSVNATVMTLRAPAAAFRTVLQDAGIMIVVVIEYRCGPPWVATQRRLEAEAILGPHRASLCLCTMRCATAKA
jgi:hypothetical protein